MPRVLELLVTDDEYAELSAMAASEARWSVELLLADIVRDTLSLFADDPARRKRPI